MSQLTENKQNEAVLIENFEPTRCARKSAQKVRVQGRRRRLCADESAQKVEKRKRESRIVETEKTGRAEALPVSTIKKFTADLNLSERMWSTAWWLRASWLSSGFSLPCSCFLRFLWSALVLGRRRILCTLSAKPCRRIEDFLCHCNSDTCAAATVRAGDRMGSLGVELINAGLNCSTDCEQEKERRTAGPSKRPPNARFPLQRISGQAG